MTVFEREGIGTGNVFGTLQRPAKLPVIQTRQDAGPDVFEILASYVISNNVRGNSEVLETWNFIEISLQRVRSFGRRILSLERLPHMAARCWAPSALASCCQAQEHRMHSARLLSANI